MIRELLIRAEGVFENDDALDEWLVMPCDGLNNMRPIDKLMDGFEDVLKVIDDMRDGDGKSEKET